MSSNTVCLTSQGKSRRSYASREWAEESARYTLNTYGKRTVPYHCERCRAWHLCPASRYTPGHHCDSCSKQAYVSERAAELRALILEREQGAILRVYECPEDQGWHLTSKR